MATADEHAAYKPQTYIEIDTSLIPAQGWPLTLIELALNRGIEEHKLLRDTGIFRNDIAQKNVLLSPQQCFQLIANVQKYNLHRDLSFLIGSRLLVDNPAPAQMALTNARNLQDALDILIRYNTLISPLLKARLDYQQDQVMIYWQDSCGAENSEQFLLEMMVTSLSSLSRWKSAQHMPWQFYFCGDKPEHIEQYQVHLPGQIHFNAPVNSMSIAREHLHTPWQSISADLLASPLQFSAQQFAAQQLAELHCTQGFLAEIYDYLHKNIHCSPNLDQSAADFGMSSASFKRKLKKHRSHFQTQYDLVRRDLAIMWLNQGDVTHEQVAQKLHFYDAANLRRAFKKWTGRLPQAMSLMD